jgi:hypothetical protein
MNKLPLEIVANILSFIPFCSICKEYESDSAKLFNIDIEMNMDTTHEVQEVVDSFEDEYTIYYEDLFYMSYNTLIDTNLYQARYTRNDEYTGFNDEFKIVYFQAGLNIEKSCKKCAEKLQRTFIRQCFDMHVSSLFVGPGYYKFRLRFEHNEIYGLFPILPDIRKSDYNVRKHLQEFYTCLFKGVSYMRAACIFTDEFIFADALERISSL